MKEHQQQKKKKGNLRILIYLPGVLVHTCNPSTQEAEAEDCNFTASLAI
jgi:hypothetical protein